jgi:hypothetical protein
MIKHRHIGHYKAKSKGRTIIKRRPLHPLRRVNKAAMYRMDGDKWNLIGTDEDDKDKTEFEITERFKDVADQAAVKSAVSKGIKNKGELPYLLDLEHFPLFETQLDKLGMRKDSHYSKDFPPNFNFDKQKRDSVPPRLPRLIITDNDPADKIILGDDEGRLIKPKGKIIYDSDAIPKKIWNQGYGIRENAGDEDQITFSNPDFTRKAEKMIRDVSARRIRRRI